MRENRDLSIELCFGHEKGYVNRKTDAGGPTNMGITQRTLSDWLGRAASILDVQQLTKAEAWKIYAKNYWDPIRGDELPAGLDYAAFDYCVNSGANRASRKLQEVLVADGAKITIDGNIGVQTLAAIKAYSKGTEQLIIDYCAARLAWMKTLGGPQGFSANGRGWTIRVTGKDPKGQWKDEEGVVGNAVKMWRATRVTDPAAGPKPLPIELPKAIIEEASAKTNDSFIKITEILKKPEILTGSATAVVSVLTAISGNTAISYGIGFAIAVGALVAGWQFVRRIRNSHA